MKYLSLFWAFFKASFTADLEFRANFLIRIVTDIFWYLAQIISFEVLFNYTNTIGDWTRDKTRVFLGVLFVVDSIFMILFSINLDGLSDSVRKGSLDLLLTKPVSSQFIISLQRISTAHIGNLLMGLAWLGWSLSTLQNFSWLGVFWILLLLPSGVVIFYSLRFLFSTAAIVFTKAENIQYLWYLLYKLGMRPDNIYFPWLKYIILTIIPVGLIASVPSRLVLDIANLWLAPWTIFISLASLYFSNFVWKKALKYYASASS